MNENGLLTIDQAARLVDMKPFTMRNHIKRLAGPETIRVKNRVFIHPEALASWKKTEDARKTAQRPRRTPSGFITTKQAADAIGVSYTTLCRTIKAGKTNALMLDNGTYLFRQTDVEAMLAARLNGSKRK